MDNDDISLGQIFFENPAIFLFIPNSNVLIVKVVSPTGILLLFLRSSSAFSTLLLIRLFFYSVIVHREKEKKLATLLSQKGKEGRCFTKICYKPAEVDIQLDKHIKTNGYVL